jgi:hypothetical protein
MRVPLGFAILLLTACDEAPPLPGGRPAGIIAGIDDFDDPAVVGLTSFLGGVSCTGTIVSRHLVLTAAHCLASGPPSYVFIGPHLGEAFFLDVSSVHIHPEYDPESLEHDIAVVRLLGISPVDPIPLAARPPAPGESARFVGFGYTQINQTGEYGIKHHTSTPVTEVDPGLFWYGVATCDGDSGGPALIMEDGREAVAGLTTGGDGPCAEFGVDTRVDIHLDWLAPYLAEDPPACDADGQCAADCEDADPDCPCAADGLCGACGEPAIDPDCPRPEDPTAGDPGCAAVGPFPFALFFYLLRRKRNNPRMARRSPRLSRVRRSASRA